MDGIATEDDALQEVTSRSKKRSLSTVVDDKENANVTARSSKTRPKKKKSKSKTEKEANKDKKKKKSKKTPQPGKGTTSMKEKAEARTSESPLTRNAVDALMGFAQFVGKENPPLPENIVVRMRLDRSLISYDAISDLSPHDQTFLAVVDDGTHTLQVVLVDDLRNEALHKYIRASFKSSTMEGDPPPAWILIAIRGLIATDGHNPKYDLDPIVCLTQVELLSKEQLESTWTTKVGKPYSLPARSSAGIPNVTQSSQQQQQQAPLSSSSTVSVRAGTVGTFLDTTLPFLTTGELVRCCDTAPQKLMLSEPFGSTSAENGESMTPFEKVEESLATMDCHAEEVQTFINRHSAMMTLQASSKPTEQAVQNYTNALGEFASSQLDRQKASLVSNAGREAADRACVITTQYNAALEHAMQSQRGEVPRLTPELLMQWHKILLQDLHPEAGQIRTKTVRAGHTAFCRPKDIRSELDKFCLALSHLQGRLQLGRTFTFASTLSEKHAAIPDAWHAILFAAVAMYGIVDIHPFADANGRLSRIVANWALGSFPFTINVFATPAQRAEYVLALETTRHLLTMSNMKKVYGNVTIDERLVVIKSIGVFAPLVRLLMDRMGRAVVEFHRVWEEKSGLVAEALESKAARLARERAKKGTCLICLDENPNIATLCCGNAVHLNCIAEWLAGKNSCPNCRSEMPSISGRVVRAARNENMEGVSSRGERNAVSPSSRRLQRRYFQNSQDVIVSLLGNYDNNENTTTETTEDNDYESANDTSAAHHDDEDDSILHDDNEQTESSSSESDDEDDQSGSSSSSSSGDDDISQSDEDFTDLGSANVHGEFGADVAERIRAYIDEHIMDEHDTYSHDTYHTSEDSSEGNEGASNTQSTSRVHEYCDALYCRNRPAVDCTNNLCGRCCVLGGEFHCPRHNS